jgi:hypothetical protein
MKPDKPIVPVESTTGHNLPVARLLLTCSQMGLHEVELANLNLAANCLKRARLEWNEAVAHGEAAGVARWLIHNRDALLEQARRTLQVETGDDGLPTVSGSKRGLEKLLGDG